METPGSPVKPSLVKKLVEVMACVDRIPKSGHNTFHNYDYTTEADVCEALRGELAKRWVLIVPSAVDSKEAAVGDKGQRVFTQRMRFTAHDGESGETLSWDMFGQGSDSLDKGAFKSTTGAVKYALLKLFMVPTGDDPEKDDGAKSTTPPPPAGVNGLNARMNPTPSPRRASSGPASGAVFPNYGNLKNQPIHGAPLKDLEFYANGARRSIADPAKQRFHDAERRLLAAIEAEIAGQRSGATAAAMAGMAHDAGGPNDEPPPLTDDDAPF